MKTTIATAVLTLALPLSIHAATLTAFHPSTWPRSDAALGISGFQIEDFEDTALIPNLQIQLSGGTANYGPTNTLPRVWDPTADDPNAGKVLVPGIWDGTHVLLNRQSAPLPVGYVDGEWADTTFIVSGGVISLGFSIEQIDLSGTQLIVTTTAGATTFALDVLANFVTPGGGRNGYIRIDASAGESILSAKIDNTNGDGVAFDHLAVNVPEPATALLVAVGMGGMSLSRRSRKRCNG